VWFRKDGVQGLQLALEIVFLKNGAILSVPFGALTGMPLPLTFRIAACLLPVTKTRVRNEPFPAYPAGSFSAVTFLSHCLLLQVTCWRTMAVFMSIE
jgi:hypothetical protein